MRKLFSFFMSALIACGSFSAVFAQNGVSDRYALNYTAVQESADALPSLRYTPKSGAEIFDALPSAYDARLSLSFPEIRDQGEDGDCWAYASSASAEISLLKQGEPLTYFSEAHMADNLYYNRKNPWSLNLTTGGNRETAAMYFSRGSGPVAADSYSGNAGNTFKEDISDNLAAYVNTIEYLPDTERYIYSKRYTEDSVGAKYPQDKRYTLVGEISGKNAIKVLNGADGYASVQYDEYDRLPAGGGAVIYHLGRAERDRQIKEAVMEHGSVFSSYYADPDNKYLNVTNSAYYYPYSLDGNFAYVKPINHAINIIGWNDSYPKGNFKDTPPKDGAWIVRNSWGDDILDDGYFYISYYDATIGENSAVFADIETKPDFENIYQHDPFGQTSYFEMPSGSRFANRFDKKSSGDEYITEIGVYIQQEDTKVEISVNGYTNDGENTIITWYDEEYKASIDDYAESSGSLFREDHPSPPVIKSKTFSRPGYYVIKLDEPVKIESDSFDVTVRYSNTNGSNVLIPTESRLIGRDYNDNAAANLNESFWCTGGDLTVGEGENMKAVASIERWNAIMDSSTGHLSNACIKVMTSSDPAGMKDPSEKLLSGSISKDTDGNKALSVKAADSVFESGKSEKKLIIIGASADGLPSVESISLGQTVSVPVCESASDIRVLLWEDLNTIRPLSDPITVCEK